MTAPPDIFRVPEPAAWFDAEMPDGAVIRVRRHGNPAGPRLVMAHGNGFAIDAYYPFWRLLLERYDLAIYDQRNHGRNPRHDVGRHDVPAFVADMDRLVELIPAQFRRQADGRRVPLDLGGDRDLARARSWLALGRAGAVRPAADPLARPPGA